MTTTFFNIIKNRFSGQANHKLSLKAILVVAALFLGGHNGHAQQELPKEEKMFSPAELLSDLDSLYHWINTSHPDLYSSIEKVKADENWELVRSQIKVPMKSLEFARLISPLITQYKDGHLNLGAYFWEDEAFQDYLKREGKFFPLHVKVKNGKIFVIEGTTDGKIKAGAEITSINGESASEIINSLLTQVGSDTRANAEATISRLFNTTLWYIYGWGITSLIEFYNPSETNKITTVLPGSSFEEVLRFNFPKGNKKMDLLLYEEEGLAIIETYGFISNKKTQQFLDSVFTVIKNKNIHTVAVDLRKNGGGSSSVGDEMLKYLTKKPYSQAIRSERLKSGLLSKPYNKWILNIFEHPENKDALVHNRLIFENESPVVPNLEKPELFHEGKFYLLTGPQTFSSAHMMAAAVKAYGLGTIIGESTGSRMTFFGDPALFYLPNTKISGYIPTVKHWMPGYTEKSISASVEPDVLIETGPRDLAEGKDPVLEYLKLVASGRNF